MPTVSFFSIYTNFTVKYIFIYIYIDICNTYLWDVPINHNYLTKLSPITFRHKDEHASLQVVMLFRIHLTTVYPQNKLYTWILDRQPVCMTVSRNVQSRGWSYVCKTHVGAKVSTFMNFCLSVCIASPVNLLHSVLLIYLHDCLSMYKSIYPHPWLFISIHLGK